MFSYLKQIEMCEPVLDIAKRAIIESNDITTRAKIVDIPTKEAVLRAASIRTDVNTEEQLRAFTLWYVLRTLHLSEMRTEQLRLTCLQYMHSDVPEK